MKKTIVSLFVIGLLSASFAFAAAPDGVGPWADTVVSSLQGLKKNGTLVDALRSNPTAALGTAETTGTPSDSNTTPTNFFSLGFGGTLTVGFDNAILNGAGPDLTVYEVTGGTYPDEKVKVEASHNGTDWTTLSESTARDSSLDLGMLQCAKYVRVTDVSDPNLFEATADGYDVDAVKALYNGTSCDLAPAIQVVKSSDFSEVFPGETVTYSYAVTNEGDFDLSDVAVSDNMCSPLSGPSGDDGDAVLEQGETWTYTCSMELNETTTNVATASAKDPWNHDISDTDELTVGIKELGCTLTQGYWKTHGPGSKHEDETWGLLSDAAAWLEIMLTPVKGNAWYQLAHQYVAAKLNILNGAYASPEVQNAVATAEDLLDGIVPFSVPKSDKQLFTDTAGVLGSYNEGFLGTPHCSD